MNIIEFACNTKGIVDLDFLKGQYLDKNGSLNNADIIAELFGFRENSKFKQAESESGLKFNFKEWNITQEDWYLLIKFLKFGNLNSEPKKIRNEKLEQLYLLGHKLGGIPSLDCYYQEFHDNSEPQCINEPTDEYNPQSPEQDRFKLYRWACVDNNNNNSTIYNMVNNHHWENTEVHFSVGISDYFYLRKLRE